LNAGAAALLGAAVPLAVLVVVAVVGAISRRRTRQRVHAAAARLSSEPLGEHRGLEATIGELERAVDDAVSRVGDVDAAGTRLSLALTAIHDGVVLLDEAGDIVFTNRRAGAFLGGRHGEAIVESTIEELARTALAGEEATETLELFGPPRRTLVLTADPLDDGHRSIGALVVIEDVTERRRVDAVRRDFVANISHELKTPVGGLGVLAEAIVDEDDLAVIRRLASRIHHESMRASRTIDDLLELSRIEAGEAARREPVPVHLVLAEAVERAAGAAERQGITIDLREPARALAVMGDRRQLASAVFNLLDNAIKYSPAGSTVRVHADSEGDQVRLVVADEGIGIPRRDLERVFERFYRVDRARSRDTGGTGLGLAIVRHVASNHGGEIAVESREGAGSTFWLSLPSGESAARPHATDMNAQED
jgi:two-component system, OmpR family, sensor histidine kinase SenX3